MEWLLYVVAVLFTLIGIVCLALVVIQLPGGWIFYGLAIIIELVDTWYLPGDNPWTFSPWVLIVGLALLGLGELLEFLGGLVGAKRGGASRAGTWGSLAGGIVGALVLAAPLAVIPVIGPVFGALLGAIIGSFAGAWIGEVGIARQSMRGSMKPATWAAVGRILGTTGKFAVTVVLWVLLCAAAFYP